MRPITKFGLSLVAIAGIAQTIIVAAVAWPISPLALWLYTGNQYLRITLLGLTAVVLLTFLVMLLVAVFRQSTTAHLVMRSDQGQVMLSRKALANTVAEAVSREHPLKNISVDVKMLQRNQAAKVQIEAHSRKNTGLAEEGKQIEQVAKQKLAETLGVAVKSVKVILHPASQPLKDTPRVL